MSKYSEREAALLRQMWDTPDFDYKRLELLTDAAYEAGRKDILDGLRPFFGEVSKWGFSPPPDVQKYVVGVDVAVPEKDKEAILNDRGLESLVHDPSLLPYTARQARVRMEMTDRQTSVDYALRYIEDRQIAKTNASMWKCPKCACYYGREQESCVICGWGTKLPESTGPGVPSRDSWRILGYAALVVFAVYLLMWLAVGMPAK